MNLAEMRARVVKSGFLDYGGDPIVDQWINEALREIENQYAWPWRIKVWDGTDGTDDPYYRLFGSGDSIELGSLPTVTNFTLALIIRPDSNGGIFESGALTVSLSGGKYRLYVSGDPFPAEMTTTATLGEWALLAISKEAGSAAPEFTVQPFGGAGVTETGSQNVSNPSSLADVIFGGSIEAGLAVAGWWSRVLTPTEIAGLTESPVVDSWTSLTPTALWVFNQGSTSQAVVDSMGNTGDQSFLTGTRAIQGDLPFTYFSQDNGGFPIEDLAQVYRVTCDGQTVDYEDYRNLVERDPDMDETGDPIYWYMLGEDFRVWPATEKPIQVVYLRTPQTLSADSDEPEIPELFHELIVTGARIRGFRHTQSFEAASLERQEWSAGITELYNVYSRRNYDSDKLIQQKDFRSNA